MAPEAPNDGPGHLIATLKTWLAREDTTPPLRYMARNCSLPKEAQTPVLKLCNTYMFIAKWKNAK